MNFAIQTFGCKVNAYETEVMIESCLQAGFNRAQINDNNIDIIIINSCCVTAESARKCKQAIRRFRINNLNAIIAIVGCLSQIENHDSFPDADIILGTKNKSKIADYINQFIKTKKRIIDIVDTKQYRLFEQMSAVSSEHTRAFVKVQDGCNNFCSYCIIPYARGRECSKKLFSAITEITNLVKNGYKEIVLTGIHLDSYGKDIGTDLVNLITEVDKIEGIERIRLGSLEPTFITDENLSRLQAVKHLCPHFHLSLQSGSDKVLKSMNRKYTVNDFETAVIKLRKQYGNSVAVSTDVIVGFSTETEDDFNESVHFISSIGFSKIHVFPYSQRKGTLAYNYNPISTDIKKERVKQILAVKEISETAYNSQFIDKTLSIIVEKVMFYNNKFIISGHSENYLNVIGESNQEINVNQQINIHITKTDSDNCFGKAIL